MCRTNRHLVLLTSTRLRNKLALRVNVLYRWRCSKQRSSSPTELRPIQHSERFAEACFAFLAAVDFGRDVDADLARVDEVDIDSALGERAEHAGRDTGMGAHADAEDRELREGRL